MAYITTTKCSALHQRAVQRLRNQEYLSILWRHEAPRFLQAQDALDGQKHFSPLVCHQVLKFLVVLWILKVLATRFHRRGLEGLDYFSISQIRVLPLSPLNQHRSDPPNLTFHRSEVCQNFPGRKQCRSHLRMMHQHAYASLDYSSIPQIRVLPLSRYRSDPSHLTFHRSEACQNPLGRKQCRNHLLMIHQHAYASFDYSSIPQMRVLPLSPLNQHRSDPSILTFHRSEVCPNLPGRKQCRNHLLMIHQHAYASPLALARCME